MNTVNQLSTSPESSGSIMITRIRRSIYKLASHANWTHGLGLELSSFKVLPQVCFTYTESWILLLGSHLGGL